ncbi:MAG: chemotaxis protein CheW [Thermodesulfobacteriota bacterium]
MRSCDKIVFSFRDGDLALDVDAVDGIVEVERFFRVPHAPLFLLGIVTVHSEVITVLDLPLLFHKEKAESAPPYRLVVARTGSATLGLSIGNSQSSFLWSESLSDGQYRVEKGDGYISEVLISEEREIGMIDLPSLLSLAESAINTGGLQVQDG